MSDKNSWESFTDSVGGCLSLVCWAIAAIVTIVLATVYLPGLTGGIWKIIVFALDHATYLVYACVAVILTVIILGIIYRIRG